MMDLKVTVLLAVIVLLPCVGFIAGQSSFLSPSPSIQQSTIVVNQTATPSASVAGSLTIQSTYSMTVVQHQTSSVQPSAAVSLSSQNSSASSTPPTKPTGADDDEEDDKEEKENKKKETALIIACSSGAALLITGLILIICSHRKSQNT